MKSQTYDEPLTTRDKVEGLMFGIIFAIGFPALVFFTTQ